MVLLVRSMSVTNDDGEAWRLAFRRRSCARDDGRCRSVFATPCSCALARCLSCAAFALLLTLCLSVCRALLCAGASMLSPPSLSLSTALSVCLCLSAAPTDPALARSEAHGRGKSAAATSEQHARPRALL